MSKNFILTTSRNEKLRISAYGFENLKFSPCLIFVHGFKGFKDWGFGPYIGNYFAKIGFFILTFNFSHNGVGESLTEFIELEKFANNTFSLEISELSELISAYLTGYFGITENKKIGLLGHSRGGAISILTANKRKEVMAVALWSSVSKLDRYSDRQKEKWRKNGVFEVFNKRTKQSMKLNIALLNDIEKNKEGILNIEKAIKNLNRPLFIAHSEQDLAVPIKEAEQIFSWSNKELTEFFKVPESGHTFNIKHPFEGSNPKFEELLNRTKKFYKNNLT
jgi:uncharacterized protein